MRIIIYVIEFVKTTYLMSVEGTNVLHFNTNLHLKLREDMDFYEQVRSEAVGTLTVEAIESITLKHLEDKF